MPGVRVAGRTVDELKRPGVAVVIDDRSIQNTRLVIDPKTSLVLQRGPASPSGKGAPKRTGTVVYL
ncbi:hypothetical protein ACSNOI_48135, partial [Actinomadura kijaniata]